MEPTIYKPSIYKGAGIYKNGAGGGGISNQIPQDFVYKNILGKNYKCIEIESGVFWPVESLEYSDDDINIIENSSQWDLSVPQVSRKDYGIDGPFYYNVAARNIVNNKKTSNMKNITNDYYLKLMSYLLRIVRDWKGENVELDNTSLTTLVKNFEFSGYENFLNLLDIGLNVTGYNNGGIFTNFPYGYNKPVYFGVTSSPTDTGQMINLQYGSTILFYSSDLDANMAYQMRFFIDEN